MSLDPDDLEKTEVQESEELPSDELPLADAYPLVHTAPHPTEYPRIVPDIEPVGGFMRVFSEDFDVEEIPLYPACGQGEHCYITVRKVNRSTLEAREYLARELKVQSRDIGFAGFKDRRAVAKQTFSIAGVKAEDAVKVQAPWLQVQSATYHKNKLRTGHLRGNRFRIIIRDIEPGSAPRAQAIADVLRKTGVPNFYGPQRFGHFSDGYKIGHALLHREPAEVIRILLAPRPEAQDEFREHYANQRYEEALEALPPGRASEAAALHTLRKHPGNVTAAVRKLPREMKRMYFSAYQSYLFNWCLRERLEWGLDWIGKIETGDLAFLHQKGAVFLVEDDVAETQARADAGEVSPSGPIFGRKVRLPQGKAGSLERSVLAAEGLRSGSWLSHVKGVHLDGARRPYRVLIPDLELEELDETTLELRFSLPPGAFATILLEEIMGPGRTRLRSDTVESTPPNGIGIPPDPAAPTTEPSESPESP